MSYLKQKRSQIILTCFLMSSLLLLVFPSIDIYVSSLFFAKSFYSTKQWWEKLLYEGCGYFLLASIASVVGIFIFNRRAKKNVCGVDGKKVLYLFLVLIVGAGLIVNVILKDNFGRARPRDIEEFGGTKHFTPAFVITNECDKNCSFSSGHGAAGFFSLALALALSKRRSIYLAAAALGTLMSLSRITSGAHFFSDSTTSFFVMLIVSDVLYYYMILGVPWKSRNEKQLTSRHDERIPDLPIAINQTT